MGSLPTKPSIGFTMTVQVEAVSGNGYQPIHLIFQPRGTAFARDRHVEVTLSPRHQQNSSFLYTFCQAVTLPQGSASFSKTIYVPQYYNANNFQVELLEDGRPVRWGSAKFNIGNNLRQQFAEQRVSVGIIQPRDAAIQDAAWKIYPDVRTLITVLGDGPIPEDDDPSGVNKPVPKRLDHQQLTNLAQQVQPAWVQFRPIIEDQLPENWLGYSQLDVIIVPAPVVERIAVEQQEKMQELKSWLATGGNLWIYASEVSPGPCLESLGLSEIARHQVTSAQLALTQLELSELNDTSPLVKDEWNSATKQSQHYSYNRNGNDMSVRKEVYAQLEKAEHPFAKTASATEIAGNIQHAAFGLGEVIAIRTEDPFPGSFQFWKTISQLRGEERLNWVSRNGINVPAGDDSYWSWLIRSVGQPPVKSFVLLNLLFAILVGPFCYFFLLHRHRLYLLYFVAPALALIVTCGLFVYALTSDGISTKQRIRQISWLDSKNGVNVSQSRSTYYRVLGYGQQIDVSNDVAIYPVRHSPIAHNNYGRNSGEDRLHGEFRNADGRQLLSSGFLPTRSQVQYLSTQPWASEPSIEVDWTARTISNRLPRAVHQILVSAKDGSYWEALNLNAGAKLPLQPCRKINDQLRGMLGSKVLPDETKNPMINTYSWARNNVGSRASLLEERLQQWSGHLPENSFIGVAQMDDDRLGISNAITLDSVHVIMGELP